MANAATLEGTGDDSGVRARIQTLLPWQRKATSSKASETDPDDDEDKDSGGRRWKIPIATLICIAILIAGVGIRIFDPPFVESLRVKTFDLYQRMSPRPIGEYPVGIIDIDEKSLANVGQWPWPRRPWTTGPCPQQVAAAVGSCWHSEAPVGRERPVSGCAGWTTWNRQLLGQKPRFGGDMWEFSQKLSRLPRRTTSLER